MTRCNLVAGAVATGAPLTDAERAHLDGCADCAALVATPRALAQALARTARAADSGPGAGRRHPPGSRADRARASCSSSPASIVPWRRPRDGTTSRPPCARTGRS